MIDTIVLTLDNSKFHLNNPDLFTPSANWLLERFKIGGRSYISSKQNPTKDELRNGIYKPRLTITKRFNGKTMEFIMKIEFSAPKMIYKNNFDELDEDNFDLLIKNLLQKLEIMGVGTSEYYLRHALVSTIHYSKNIALTDGLTPFSILQEIKKSNITQMLDFNQTDYRNEGHSYKFRSNSFEIVFYDKMKDMQKNKISEKRALEHDNIIQESLFEELNESQKIKPLEVFRMEIRLNQRQKIRQILKLLGLEYEPTFQNLFKKDIAQNVLLHYLKMIEDHYPKVLKAEFSTAKNFIAMFIINNPKKGLKDALLAYGYACILKELSTREIRGIFKNKPISTWYRFNRQMNEYKYTQHEESFLSPIRVAIDNFIPLKMSDYRL